MKPTKYSPSREIAEALDREAPPERLARALSDALAATQTSRAGTVEADHRTRVQAASLILAYQVGKPVERQEIVSVNVDADSAVGLEKRLRESPALRSALRQALDHVEIQVHPEGI